MKSARFVLIFAILVVAGAVPMTAVAQPAAALQASDAYAVALSTRAEAQAKAAKLAAQIARLRDAVKAAEHRGASPGAVKALEEQLAASQAAYTALKSEVKAIEDAVAKGGNPVELAKAHADALLLLKGNKEALKVYESLHIGVAGDLSGTAASFKCPPGTAPRQKVSSAVLAGRGESNDVVFECIPLTKGTVVPEPRSVTATAVSMADAARIKASVDAARERCEREAAESPPVWKQVLGFGLGVAGLVVGSYFGIGALSAPAVAHHNGLVAGGVAGGVAVIPLGVIAATTGGCRHPL